MGIPHRSFPKRRVHERRPLGDGSTRGRASMWRITLTPAVINAAAEVLFLVSAAPKPAFYAECSRVPAVRRNCRRRRSHPPTAGCAGA